jgi:hypothetical protein
MPFFGLEPFDAAEAQYFWTGLGQPGFFKVTVRGHAQKFSFGFQLKQDTYFVGGLAIEVTGWTGPLTQGKTPYTVTGDFNGRFLHEIVVIGSNKSEVVRVEEVAFTTEEALMKQFSSA